MTFATQTFVGACALAVASWSAGAAAPSVADDAAMTCEQIGTELAPYAQQMMPNLQALGATQQQLYEQVRQVGDRQRQEDALLTPMATAGALDPTGASKRAYQAAVMAQQAKHRRESEALANSSLAKQNKAQEEQFVAQGQQLQANARIQQLMQLAQQKNCH